MQEEELKTLKDKNNKKFVDIKYTLNAYHIAIIMLIIFIMILYTVYKIGYFIFLNKYANYKSYRNTDEDNFQNNNNLFQVNNYNNRNNDMFDIEDILIPISYSRYLEDVILNTFFYDINNGYYMDISSFGDNKKSTTKYFYMKGWNGINIKPDKKVYEKLLKDRPDDINLDYYVGGKIYKTIDKYNKTNNVMVHKISDIFKNFIPKKKIIHFCKIDIEGDVRKLLLNFDFNNYRPKIFCIESVKPGTFRPDHEMFEYILNNNDYSFIYQYKINRYYMDNRASDLKERIHNIDNIIKAYKNKNKKQ